MLLGRAYYEGSLREYSPLELKFVVDIVCVVLIVYFLVKMNFYSHLSTGSLLNNA